MRQRWWGLTGRQTLVMFAVAVLVGVGVAVVLGPGGGGGGGRDGAGGGGPAPVERVAVGTPGNPDAIWVFGFETLRFDPGLRRGGQLELEGFGDVAGGPGAVYLYDAGTGRVGVLDATANELRTLPVQLVGTSRDSAFVPTLAVRGPDLWVAPDPGVAVRVDPETGTAAAPIPVAASASRATGLVANGDAVYAATESAAGVELARVEPAGTAATGVVPDATLDGVAADDSAVWLRSGVRLVELDPTTLAVVRSVDVPARGPAEGLGGLVSAAGDVWMLADGGASLLRYEPGSDRFTRTARLLDRSPGTVEVPAALVSDGRHVVAMVQRAGAADLAARLVVHEPGRARIRAVDVPGRIAPGAVAASTRGAAGDER